MADQSMKLVLAKFTEGSLAFPDPQSYPDAFIIKLTAKHFLPYCLLPSQASVLTAIEVAKRE